MARATPGRWSENPGPCGQAKDRGGCTRSCRRTRLTSDALIVRELTAEVPVRHRLGSIVSGRRAAIGRWGRLWRLADVVESVLDGGGIGDEHSARLGVRYRSESGDNRADDQSRFWVENGTFRRLSAGAAVRKSPEVR
jgi:hypothetical protein